MDYDQTVTAHVLLDNLGPLSLAVLDRLPTLAPNAAVLDVACGYGEPGLSLLAGRPDLQLVGIDSAPHMIAEAEQRAAAAGVSSARFLTMPMEKLDLPTASFDAVVSRLGALTRGPELGPATAAELARVLRPGALFALTTWDTPEHNTVLATVAAAFDEHLDLDPTLPMADLTELSRDNRRETWLHEAGMNQVDTELVPFTMPFPDVDAVWTMVTKTVAARLVAQLDPPQREEARARFVALLPREEREDGTIAVPVTGRVYWGHR
jgi:ubiquinone/menaquinone biosynthesis C-methylase UbiE